MSIIIEKIKIKITKKTISHYIGLGYNCQVGDIIEVNSNELTNGSHQRVKVKCDYCGYIYETVYYSYISKFQKKYEVCLQ